jgi:hypothetical protein
MSFLDRLKSFFSGSGDDHAGHSHDEPHAGESNLEAAAGLPPTPVDPSAGSPAPEAAPEPVAPPPPPSDPDRL